MIDVNDVLYIKILHKLKISFDANKVQRIKWKDDPLAMQYYCGWESGYKAAIDQLFGSDFVDALDD